MDDPVRVLVTVTGRVQGVSFRESTRREAEKASVQEEPPAGLQGFSIL
ncbi:MAG: acylphosphatase [Coriobacteriia bacterium]|nr:acylphosphatase [Coriobacteriia bacterium]